ncbi:MAG: amphi-Trp domain-containing protein [Haloarculaceae archaeon]
MPEETLFASEHRESRTAVASYLRAVADRLDAGEPITLESGSQSLTMTPPANVEFEVKAEREGPAGESGELSLELELEWPENAPDEGGASDGSLSVREAPLHGFRSTSPFP